MKFAIFRRKFDEILPPPKNAGISQKCSGNEKMSRDFEKKCEKNSENARNFKFPQFVRNFHFSFHFFNPLLSGIAVHLTEAGEGSEAGRPNFV